MDFKEIKLLVNIASSIIVTFTTETSLERINTIRQNIGEMTEDTAEFVKEILKDSQDTAKIVEAIIFDVMINAGIHIPTSKGGTRGVDKGVLKELRKEIQQEFEKRRSPQIQDENYNQSSYGLYWRQSGQ